jgi:hypothetical protein
MKVNIFLMHFILSLYFSRTQISRISFLILVPTLCLFFLDFIHLLYHFLTLRFARLFIFFLLLYLDFSLLLTHSLDYFLLIPKLDCFTARTLLMFFIFFILSYFRFQAIVVSWSYLCQFSLSIFFIISKKCGKL